MHYSPREFVSLAFLASASVLAACQGNIGGGSGLSIPQAPGYQQPGGPGGSNTQSRQRLLDGAVYLSPKLNAVPLPAIGGYGVSIALGTPGPVTAASASASDAANFDSAAKALKARAVKTVAHTGDGGKVAFSPSPSASAGSSASPDPSSGGAATPQASADASAAAKSPAGKTATSSSSATESAAPESSASPASKGTHTPSPASTGTSLPRFETKTIVDPDDAPPPPTPMPTGEVQTFVKRSAIIRGYVLTGADLPLYGLGAIRFTMPSSEITPKRGFTIAVFESGKHRHEKLITYDNEPLTSEGIVYSGLTAPLVLKKGAGYLLMIYGDDEALPATAPPSVPPGYPGPGNNPFPAGSGNPQPSYSQIPGYPGSNATPYPLQATPFQILPTTKPT